MSKEMTGVDPTVKHIPVKDRLLLAIALMKDVRQSITELIDEFDEDLKSALEEADEIQAEEDAEDKRVNGHVQTRFEGGD